LNLLLAVDARARPALKIGFRAFRPSTTDELAECMTIAASPACSGNPLPMASTHAAEIEEIEFDASELDQIMAVLRVRHRMLQDVGALSKVGDMKLAYLCRFVSSANLIFTAVLIFSIDARLTNEDE
jgi:hypothetical protein